MSNNNKLNSPMPKCACVRIEFILGFNKMIAFKQFSNYLLNSKTFYCFVEMDGIIATTKGEEKKNSILCATHTPAFEWNFNNKTFYWHIVIFVFNMIK